MVVSPCISPLRRSCCIHSRITTVTNAPAMNRTRAPTERMTGEWLSTEGSVPGRRRGKCGNQIAILQGIMSRAVAPVVDRIHDPQPMPLQNGGHLSAGQVAAPAARSAADRPMMDDTNAARCEYAAELARVIVHFSPIDVDEDIKAPQGVHRAVRRCRQVMA